jgi:hypothetical protein
MGSIGADTSFVVFVDGACREWFWKAAIGAAGILYHQFEGVV